MVKSISGYIHLTKLSVAGNISNVVVISRDPERHIAINGSLEGSGIAKSLRESDLLDGCT